MRFRVVKKVFTMFGATNSPLKKARRTNKCVFALAETHLPCGVGVVVVEVVVTFWINWARAARISLKSTYNARER